MTLRTKLIAGYAGFILALMILGAWSARTLLEMSAVSLRIITENYDSVIAAQDMKESLERQDSAALFDLLGDDERAGRQAREHRERFDAAFSKAARNITEPGEAELLAAIDAGRARYYTLFDSFLASEGDRHDIYFEQLEPQFDGVRAAADRLLHLNQEAMRRKADIASATARSWFTLTLGLALGLFTAGIAVQVSLTRSVLRPVRELTEATTRVAAGDLDSSVPVHSQDEIGALAAGFNRMAERIRELRRSDLGKLLVAQQTAEAAIDSLYDPVIVTDRAGRVTRVNPPAEHLFGTRGGLIGQPVEAVIRDARIVQAVADVLRSSQPAGSEDSVVLPWAIDGTRRAFRVHSTPMRDDDQRLVGAVTLLEDITHLSELNRLKSEFLAAASHELRTPLTSVQMGIHLLIEGAAGPTDDRQREILQVCREDTERLDRLMRQLLDLSKIESGVSMQRERIRPSVLVREAVEAVHLQLESRGIQLAVDAPPDLNDVPVDRQQIVRVLTNLLTNALRATSTGGKISVSVSRRGDSLAFAVADTGAGIPRAFLTKIFEPFVQLPNSAPGGTGLGLTLSRRIVEQHGGQMSVQSQEGEGSTFTFTIPMTPAQTTTAAEAQP